MWHRQVPKMTSYTTAMLMSLLLINFKILNVIKPQPCILKIVLVYMYAFEDVCMYTHTPHFGLQLKKYDPIFITRKVHYEFNFNNLLRQMILYVSVLILV